MHSDELVDNLHTPYDPNNLPEWWPENEEPLADLSRPRLWSLDGQEELVFPVPIVFQGDPYEGLHENSNIVAFVNEFERGRLHFVSGTNPPITRMEWIMIEQVEIRNGRMVDYHKWVMRFAEQMVARFPGGDPYPTPGTGLQDCSNVAIGGLNPGSQDCAPDLQDNRVSSSGGDEVPEPRYINVDYIDEYFTPEELEVELAYNGDIFQQVSFLYKAFKSGGYSGAPAAFAHILPQALSDFVHQLGYTGPIIAQANGGMYPYPDDYMDYQVYRTMPRPWAEVYNERMRQRKALESRDNDNNVNDRNPSDATVMAVNDIQIGNATIGYSNNLETHPAVKEAKKDQLFERLAVHGTPSPGTDPQTLTPVSTFKDKDLPFPRDEDEHPDVNSIIDDFISNDQPMSDATFIALLEAGFKTGEATRQMSLDNSQPANARDEENASLIQTQQETIEVVNTPPNLGNGVAVTKPVVPAGPEPLQTDIQPSNNGGINGFKNVGENTARIGEAIERPKSEASVRGFEFEIPFVVVEGRLEKFDEDYPLLEACFEANEHVPAAVDPGVINSTGFIEIRHIGILEDSKKKVGTVCDEIVDFASGYVQVIVHELEETPAHNKYGEDDDDSEYEFHPDVFSPEDFDEFFGEEAQEISDALYTEAREWDLEAKQERMRRKLEKAAARQKMRSKGIYWDLDDDSDSDSGFDSDSDYDIATLPPSPPPPVRKAKAKAPKKKAPAPRKKRNEGVLANNKSRGNQPIVLRNDPALVSVDKAKPAANLGNGTNGAVLPANKLSKRATKPAPAKPKKAATPKTVGKKRRRAEESIVEGDNTDLPVLKRINTGQSAALIDHSNTPRQKFAQVVTPVEPSPELKSRPLSFSEKNQLTAEWLADIPAPQPIQSVVQDNPPFYQDAYAHQNPNNTHQIEDDYAVLQQLIMEPPQMMNSEVNLPHQDFQANGYMNNMEPTQMMNSQENPQYPAFNAYTNNITQPQMISEEYPQDQAFPTFPGFQGYPTQSFQSYTGMDMDLDIDFFGFDCDFAAFDNNEINSNNMFDPQYNVGDYTSAGF
ncbi:hypothetical protein K440DRAFT_674045 [Wilcoxina mikolae CBS 423.85]|nr:hypothetical protein K440DRAFT_674045 [Wilcoxina mikolae CBS 423.85]